MSVIVFWSLETLENTVRLRGFLSPLLRRITLLEPNKVKSITISRHGQVIARLVPPKPRDVLAPDLLAARRNHLQTPTDIPNLGLLLRQKERY